MVLVENHFNFHFCFYPVIYRKIAYYRMGTSGRRTPSARNNHCIVVEPCVYGNTGIGIFPFISKPLCGQSPEYLLSLRQDEHAVYTISDPRAGLLKEMARDLAKEKGLEKEYAFMELIEERAIKKFMEGNGRSTRIWLDLILKKRLRKCVDWSKIGKREYMNAMIQSPLNSNVLKKLLESSLTDKINDREMFMKGIDYSYYYEEND